MPSIKLTINGQQRELNPVESLAALIDQLGMRLDRVAVELNRQLVPRDRWAATPVSDGDRLEIVHFVGGGLFLCSMLPPHRGRGKEYSTLE